MEPTSDQTNPLSHALRIVKYSFYTVVGLFMLLTLIWLLGHFSFLQ